MQASLDFVVAAANGEGVRTLHRPAGALPGETGTFAELANGNRVIRFTGYAADGKISINESKRLLRETIAIQHVLLQMKLNLEDEAG